MQTDESFLRDAGRIVVWYPFRWFISFLPLPLGFRMFSLLGEIHYSLSRKKRKMIVANLNRIGEWRGSDFSPKIAARQYFETHYVDSLLIFLFPRLSKDNIDSIHVFQGLGKIEEGQSEKRGCILLHAHFGPVHLPLFHLGLMDYKVKQLGYLRKPKGLSRIGEKVSFRLREKYESKIPAEVIQANSFLREPIRHLQENGLLLITGDGTGRGEYVGQFIPLPFLGENMIFPIGAAKMARMANADIIPMFTIKQRTGRYITIIEEPIISQASGNSFDAEKVTTEFASLLEHYVKKYPQLWHLWDEFYQGKLIR